MANNLASTHRCNTVRHARLVGVALAAALLLGTGCGRSAADVEGQDSQPTSQTWLSAMLCKDVHCSCEDDDSCYSRENCPEQSAGIMEMLSRKAMIPVVESFHRYFRGDYDNSSCPPEHRTCKWEMPVHVMNLAVNKEKRAHMTRMLALLGFTSVSFPDTGSTLGEDCDFDELCKRGWITEQAVDTMRATPRVGEGGVRAYVANAMGHLSSIEAGVDAGHSHFIIMEDDLVLSADPFLTRERIRAAVEDLPETADMLYLEMCFETCHELCGVAGSTNIARARRPKCSGAILYTARGAVRVMELCKPIFAAVDNMLPILIERGLLEAYVMTPPAFAQDSFFGSSVGREQAHLSMVSAGLHFPVAHHCRERGARFWQAKPFSLAYELRKGTEEDSKEYLLTVLGVNGSELDRGSQTSSILVLRWREVLSSLQCSNRRFFVRSQPLDPDECFLFEDVLLSDEENGSVVTGEIDVFERNVEPSDATQLSSSLTQRYWELYFYTEHFPWPVLVMPLDTAERKKFCFMVHSQELVDTQPLLANSASVVSLISTLPPVGSVPAVLYSPNTSVAVQRQQLLQAALDRYAVPLVQFDWFVWCTGDSVVDGRCADAARQLHLLRLHEAGMTAWRSEAVAAVSWRECRGLVLSEESTLPPTNGGVPATEDRQVGLRSTNEAPGRAAEENRGEGKEAHTREHGRRLDSGQIEPRPAETEEAEHFSGLSLSEKRDPVISCPDCNCSTLGCSCWWDSGGLVGPEHVKFPEYGEIHSSQDFMERFPRSNSILGGIMHASTLVDDPSIQQDVLSFPAFVISDLKSAAKRRQTSRVLQALGFNNVIFPPFLSHEDISPQLLRERGLMGPLGQQGLKQLQMTPWVGKQWRKVLSLALNHLDCLRLGLNSESSFFAVFEDDVMLGASASEARARLHNSLLELPPTADLLYLEFCYEACSSLVFYRRFAHIVPAAKPACTAAMLFSRAGARRILAAMHPVFLALDNMYAALIGSGRLEAFLTFPPVLAQDGFWASSIRDSSDSARRVGTSALAGRTHRAFGEICSEHKGIQGVMSPVQLLPENLAGSWLVPSTENDVMVLMSSDTFISPKWNSNECDWWESDAMEIHYRTLPRLPGSCAVAGDYCIELASAAFRTLQGSITLRVTERSLCWHNPFSCTIQVKAVNTRTWDDGELLVNLTRRMVSFQPPRHFIMGVLLPAQLPDLFERSRPVAPHGQSATAEPDEQIIFPRIEGEQAGALRQLVDLASSPLVDFDYIVLVGDVGAGMRLAGLSRVLKDRRPLVGLIGRVEGDRVAADTEAGAGAVWVLAQQEVAGLLSEGVVSLDMQLNTLSQILALQIGVAHRRWRSSEVEWTAVPLCGAASSSTATATKLLSVEATPSGPQAVFQGSGAGGCHVILLVASNLRVQEGVVVGRITGERRRASEQRRWLVEGATGGWGLEIRDCSMRLEGNKSSECWDTQAAANRQWMANRHKYQLALQTLEISIKDAPTLLPDGGGLLVDAGSGLQVLPELLAAAEDALAQLIYVPVDLEETVPHSGTRICDLNAEFPLFVHQNVAAFIFAGSMEYLVDKLSILRACRSHPGARVVMHYFAAAEPAKHNRNAPRRWVAQLDIFALEMLARLSGFALRVFRQNRPDQLKVLELSIAEAEAELSSPNKGFVFLFTPDSDSPQLVPGVAASCPEGFQPRAGGATSTGGGSEGPRLGRGVHAVWAYPCRIPEGVLEELQGWVRADGRSAPVTVTVHCGNSICMEQTANLSDSGVTAKWLDMRELTRSTPMEQTLFRHSSYHKLVFQSSFSRLLQQFALLCVAHRSPAPSLVLDLAVLNTSFLTQSTSDSNEGWVALSREHDSETGWEVAACQLSLIAVRTFLPLWLANLADLLPAPPLDKLADKKRRLPSASPHRMNALQRYLALQRARSVAHARGVVVRLLLTQRPARAATWMEEPCSRHEVEWGVLSYNWRVQTGGGSNIGDEMQSLAATQLVPAVALLVDRDRQVGSTGNYTGSQLHYFANGWYGDAHLEWPPRQETHPILLSLHLDHRVRERFASLASKTFLQRRGPAGARDQESKDFLVSLGVDAFTSGCMTLLLHFPIQPARQPDSVLLIDVAPHLLRRAVPPYVQHAARTLFHYLDPPDHHPDDPLARFEVAYAHLNTYATASLVVTGRLHVALPCVALGTPVILLLSSDGDAPGLGNSVIRWQGLVELFHTYRVPDDGPLPTGLVDFEWSKPPANPRPDLLLKYQQDLWDVVRKHASLLDAARVWDSLPLWMRGQQGGATGVGGMLGASLRHPETAACLLRLDDIAPTTRSEVVNVKLDCATAGVRYCVRMQIKDGGLLVSEVDDEWLQEDVEPEFRSMPLPALSAKSYVFEFVAMDAYPGLEDNVLAVHRRQVQVSPDT